MALRRLLPALALIGLLGTVADAQIIQPGPSAGTFLQPQENTTLIGVQNQDAVKFTGGTIDGVTIGGLVPAPGTFTTLTVSGSVTFGSLTLGTPLPFSSGGLGTTASGIGTILVGTGPNSIGFTASPTITGPVTITGALSAGSLTLGTPCPVASGCLGFNGSTTGAGSVLAYSATGVIAPTQPLIASQILIGQGNGSLPIPKYLSGDSTLDPTGKMVNTAINGVQYPVAGSTNTVPVVTFNDGRNPPQVAYQAVANASLAPTPGRTLKGNANASQGPPADLTLGQITTLLGLTPTPQGRLTLTTATPVMTATVSGATTIYYTPYVGATVAFFDGTNWNPTICAEITNLTTASAVGNAGPAAVTTSSIYDLFVWLNGSACTLTRGPLWTNSTTRSAGTALVRQNGLWLNSVAITNGPAASRGTYVGTIASNGSSQIDYIFGAAAGGGTAASLQLWNAYQRVSTGTNVTDNGAPYTLTSSTIRQARGSAGNQIGFVIGLNEDVITATYNAGFAIVAVSGGVTKAGIGLDSTTAYLGQSLLMEDVAATVLNGALGTAVVTQPGIGTHVLSANESSDNANANTFDANSVNTLGAILRN